MSHEYLSRHKFLRAREMAAENAPLEAIAAELGLCLKLVEAILQDQAQPSRIVVDDDQPLREEILTSSRCPGCGALVYAWPCLACQMAGQISPPPAAGPRVRGANLKQKLRRLKRRRAA
jgi:hypothetical protein